MPLVMSFTALAVVLGHIGMYGIAREADEGTAAHLWQLLMAGQLPIVALFAFAWLPKEVRFALFILALQLVTGLVALAPVYLVKL